MVKILCVFFLLACFPAAAGSYVVHSDRGGPLSERLLEIDQIKEEGLLVEIRGRVCFSTCTMFLGLPGVCVEPTTTFGFHGPTRGGRRLAQEQFDYFSLIIAQYYPEPLKGWFMAEGRHRIRGVYRVSGADLIAQGLVVACT